MMLCWQVRKWNSPLAPAVQFRMKCVTIAVCLRPLMVLLLLVGTRKVAYMLPGLLASQVTRYLASEPIAILQGWGQTEVPTRQQDGLDTDMCNDQSMASHGMVTGDSMCA